MPDQSTTYCVIGQPIDHSLSPEIHTFIREQLNLSFVYEAIEVSPAMLDGFVKHSRSSLQPGFNITIPHKETIIPLLDKIDPPAERAGAVNTVSNDNGKLTGYNTDIIGCRQALEIAGIKTARTAVIIGAGGAARAGASALIEMGCTGISLLSRNSERALKICSDFSDRVVNFTCGELNSTEAGNCLSSAELIINATPVGMWPNTEESPLHDPDVLKRETTVMDMVPTPPLTLLLRQAESRGCRTISGLDMLIGQAIAAQEIWQDRPLPKSIFYEVKQYLLALVERMDQPPIETD